MSSENQSILYFIAFLGCVLASFSSYWGPSPVAGWRGFHPGWAGLAAFVFVFFWTAVKAS